MTTRDWTDEEQHLIFDAIMPIFDRHLGHPEAAKEELKNVLSEAGGDTQVRLAAVDFLCNIIDAMEKLRREKLEAKTCE